MTRYSSVLVLTAVAMLIAFTAGNAGAQGSAVPTPHVAPSPPPTPPKTIVPSSALPPTDSSVALCNNGTWIYIPGVATDCAQRAGLRVAMPRRAPTPQIVAAATAAQASVVAPARVALTPPATSTMQCKDGTFLYGAPSADRCANNGGLAAIFARPTPPPARPTRP